MHVLAHKEIFVTRREANFDRACDEAYSQAIELLGINEDGHSSQVKGWERSNCCIRITFVRYQCLGSTHTYTFCGDAVQGGPD